MARESFSDPELAAYLNDNFVAIKVDREEHAEVDSTYLAAASAFTSNLGWPLNVFVTPQGRAFFAGTYWPPAEAQGLPSFRQIIEAVQDAWSQRRDKVEEGGQALAAALAHPKPADTHDLPQEFDPIVAELLQHEDSEFGGFGAAPKFPMAPVLRFLTELGAAGSSVAQELAERTLDAMAGSELRDTDGGFFRYAIRRDWSEPHYERMLYDNAQLLACYAIADRLDIADGIADFLIRTMRLPTGAFASAQDSESTVAGERSEGGYYALDSAGRSREKPPALDQKILTGWNGLAIEALSIAATLFERDDWLGAARSAADFVIDNHLREGRLVRASIDGLVSTASATLEDYGMLATGLLHLATATGEVRYASAGRALVDASMAAGTPFGVPGGADPVLAAQGLALDADPTDGAYPSGISAMASAALRLYLLTAEARYRGAAERAMTEVSASASQRPESHGAALAVMAALARPSRQLVVVTDDPHSPVAALARSQRRPLVSVVGSAQAAELAAEGFELYEGRSTQDGAATAYVCEDFVCRLPVTSVAELAALMASGAT
jgi:uncharacterized protein YyaL (SSP411 family)